ncbi:MAG: c-type cytochrome [Microscillaceae bacterium]|nr:c-type cytochrome [Microscillaceae bacterium]MDW8460113.1 cbb3-type cytochrome c oxidase N-terminal domain-containing protein [Cytophagales bacterium]
MIRIVQNIKEWLGRQFAFPLQWKPILVPLLIFAGLISTLQAKAQASTAPITQIEWLIIIVVTLTIVVAVLTLITALYSLYVVQLVVLKKSPELAQEGMFSSMWKAFEKRMTRAIPVSREHEIILDHNYDGIKELNNHLPPWWVYMFYATIAFSAAYLFLYHVIGFFPLSEAEYQAEVKQAEIQIAEYQKKNANSIDEKTVKIVKSEKELAEGKNIYQSKCAACHGALGEGGVGPNLTDEYWLHGGSINDIFKTIKYGVPQKGMISWQQQLKPVEIQNVANYILSLQGTNPPNAKPPQGQLYKAPVATK